MELLIGAMLVSAWAMVIPQAIADAITTMRASRAGQWKLIEADRQRRAERWRKAWAATRARRNRQAGGNGNPRPGLGAYLQDVYHGFWEDRIARRQAIRAARPPYQPTDRPSWSDRLHTRLAERVRAMRTHAGRVGRVLITPVGETSRPATTPADAPTDQQPTEEPPVGESRIACPDCGATLVEVDGRWSHPDGRCPAAPTDPAPEPTAETPKQEKKKEKHTAPCPRCGTPYTPNPRYGYCIRCWRRDNHSCARCGATPHTLHQAGNQLLCNTCRTQHTTATETPTTTATYARCQRCNIWHNTTTLTDQRICATCATRKALTGGTMTITTATGEVVDVETCEMQLDAMTTDLNTLGDVFEKVEDAIKQLSTAADNIQQWLLSKGAGDNLTGGLTAITEALNAERLREVYEGIDVAKAGVQASITALNPLREAADLIGEVHGSALNGR